jgi:thiamine monophosphate synthase
VDYLLAGHVFDTTSKPGAAHALGLDRLQGIVKRAGAVPVLAIGGITRDRVTVVAETGVSGLAAIGAFIPDGPVRDLSSIVQKLAEALRFRFDRHRYVP